MTAATITAPETEDGSFLVSDAMYVEVQAIISRGSGSMAKHAVFYPSTAASGGWDFELAYDDREARSLAREIGPDAVILDL